MGSADEGEEVSDVEDADDAPKVALGVLQAWLARPAEAAAGPIVLKPGPPPTHARVLVLSSESVSLFAVLSAVAAVQGEVYILVDPAAWDSYRDGSSQLSKVAWATAIKQYAPPWYQDTTLIKHLLSPVSVVQGVLATGHAPSSSSCRVVVCFSAVGLLDSAIGEHLLGTFDRILDVRGLAGCAVAARADYAAKMHSLLACGGRVLVCAAERAVQHDAGSAKSAPSLGMDEMRLLFVPSRLMDVHLACAPQFRPLPRGQWEKRLVFSASRPDVSGRTFRPPGCPCCL
jgi:hypothetical protein